MKVVATVGLAVGSLGVLGMPLPAQPADHTPVQTVSAVRHWVNADSVRVAIEVSGDFDYRTDRLENPERVYFDIRNSRPDFDSHSYYVADVNSTLLKKIRVAEPTQSVTRVVLDLNAAVSMNVTHLRNPNRLMIELRAAGKPSPALSTDPADPPPAPADPPAAETAPIAAPVRPFTPPEVKKPVSSSPAPPTLAPTPVVTASNPRIEPLRADTSRPDPPLAAKPAKPDPPPSAPASLPTAVTEMPGTGPAATADAKPARRTSAGVASLTRALGLKLNRVVIDPGHGGHDQGTAGPHGLLEKELVLDVSLRLGKLIEQELGTEVLYTRNDDSFVALERRTQFANEKRADLFISVHANSSSYPSISGVETYVLNFTDNRSALDVAMRENATAQKPMSDLRDIIQDISAHDKAQESKDFAGKIQAALFGFESRNFPGEYNRGVKQAPFVVLIGTQMPAILTEIGFVTNPKEEALLKKAEYRQKLAESIFHGVMKYNDSLSHFTLAQGPSGN